MSAASTTLEAKPRNRSRTVEATLFVAGGSALFALVAFPIVSTHEYAWFLAGLLLAASGAAAMVDARTHLLPDRYTAPITAAGLVQAAAVSLATLQAEHVTFALLAAVAVFVSYTLLGMLGWVGFGDAKFAAALTLTVGIYAGLTAIYLVPVALIIAAVSRLILTAFGHGRGSHAHGPAIAASAALILIWTLCVMGT